jgi:hypothetical protein
MLRTEVWELSPYVKKKTEHPWLKNADKASNVREVVRLRLKQFSYMNKFKKMALGVSWRWHLKQFSYMNYP